MLHRLLISHLAKDDVLAIEPAGDDGGDEELGAVASKEELAVIGCAWLVRDLRVGTRIGHGQESRLVVHALEVLIGKFLAIDGDATGALCMVRRMQMTVSGQGDVRYHG